jgi:hypothetical protein
MDEKTAVQLVGRRLHHRAMADARVHHGPIRRPQPRQVELLNLRIETLDGHVEIPFDRPRRGVVERQLDGGTRRGDGDGGAGLFLGARGFELARRVLGDFGQALLLALRARRNGTGNQHGQDR